MYNKTPNLQAHNTRRAKKITICHEFFFHSRVLILRVPKINKEFRVDIKAYIPTAKITSSK
jgi:hypothetical protein